MEFACGFVYVPPSAEGQSLDGGTVKRSALLPPVKWARPRRPPPPPPLPPREIDSTTSLTFSTKVTEQTERKKKTEPFDRNAEIHQQPAPPQKTALVPPHMKASAESQWFPHGHDPEPPKGDLDVHPRDPSDSYDTPGGGGHSPSVYDVPGQMSAPPLLSRPAFLQASPEYLELLPSPSSTSSPSQKSAPAVPPRSQPVDKEPLPGNPNVVLVSLGKLLSDEGVQLSRGEPAICSSCGSVLDASSDSNVSVCYFCQSRASRSSANATRMIPPCAREGLFPLDPNGKRENAAETLLLFCIDTSGSMSTSLQVKEGDLVINKTRLQFLQEAVIQCLQSLSQQQPDIRVGLITFNFKVTMHGYGSVPSCFLSGAELRDTDFLKEAAASFPRLPPLSQTKEFLQKQVMGLTESGTTALGPAALVAITMASRFVQSKVIICTDGKANTELGNLETEDGDTHALLSSTIFYQELGEYAAGQGVTVSVLSIEGTECRLDELGRLADRTGGRVVIASPHRLNAEFEEIIENRTIATHCTVKLLLPKSLRVTGEREAGHKCTREVGNIDPDKEITFQFGASEHNAEGEWTPPPVPGSSVSVQLQIRYRRRNGQMMLRVLTAERPVTDDSSAALSGLSLAIIQLNSSQASAALAVRGRFHDARRESEEQRKLIEKAMEQTHSADDRQTYMEWVESMELIYYNTHTFTRRTSVLSDSESLTDAGAALLYAMKHSNRKSISVKNKRKPDVIFQR